MYTRKRFKCSPAKTTNIGRKYVHHYYAMQVFIQKETYSFQKDFQIYWSCGGVEEGGAGGSAFLDAN